MSETFWRALRKIQPCKEDSLPDMGLDSPPVNWSDHMISGVNAGVLNWWKANAFNFSLRDKAAHVIYLSLLQRLGLDVGLAALEMF